MQIQVNFFLIMLLTYTNIIIAAIANSNFSPFGALENDQNISSFEYKKGLKHWFQT